MKRKLLALALVFVILALVCSCGDEPYVPAFTLPDGFALDGGVVKASLVNEYFFDPYGSIICLDGGYVEMYADDTFTEYFEGGLLELKDGENDFMLLFMNGDRHAAYRLEIKCVMILDFRIETVSKRVYSVGDGFDRSTVRVIAEKEDGSLIEVSDYAASYSFDAPGACRVDITYGKITHSTYVEVK